MAGAVPAVPGHVVLPKTTLTPGALNPQVRQVTITNTICKRGWTRTIRPPVSYTNALKRRQMILYRETGSPSNYEEDHFIPLELGGAPSNPKNLWPEPRSQSSRSDPVVIEAQAASVQGHALAEGCARGHPRVQEDAGLTGSAVGKRCSCE